MSQQILVRDAMSYNSFSLKANLSVEEAAAELLANNLPGAPVINERREVIGFASEHDLLCKLLSSSYHGSSGASVEDVMRKDVLSINPDDSIIELAQIMSRADKPKVFPVVEGNKLVGTITRGLLLKSLVLNRAAGR